MLSNDRDFRDIDSMSLPETKTMCSLLWSHLFVGPNGVVKPCCRFSLKDAPTEEQKLNGIFQSKQWQEFRQKALKGEQIPGCIRCYEEEASQRSSLRQRYNQSPLGLHSCQPQKPQLNWIEISFSNTCNLACRMCDSRYSSKWLADEIKAFGKPLYNSNRIDFQNEDLQSLMPTLKQIKMTGGEPLIDKKHLPFLKSLEQKTDISQIELDYSTNVTVFPQKEVIDLWKKFKRVEIALSIDSLNEKEVPYIRYPSTTKEIKENTFKFLSLLDELDNFHITLRPTISLFNIFSLPEVLLWWDDLKTQSKHKDRLKETITNLTFPKYLHPNALTERQKSKVAQHFDKIKTNNKAILSLLSSFKILMKTPSEPGIYQIFLNKTKAIDHIRQQNFREVFAHLSED